MAYMLYLFVIHSNRHLKLNQDDDISQTKTECKVLIHCTSTYIELVLNRDVCYMTIPLCPAGPDRTQYRSDWAISKVCVRLNRTQNWMSFTLFHQGLLTGEKLVFLSLFSIVLRCILENFLSLSWSVHHNWRQIVSELHVFIKLMSILAIYGRKGAKFFGKMEIPVDLSCVR